MHLNFAENTSTPYIKGYTVEKGTLRRPIQHPFHVFPLRPWPLFTHPQSSPNLSMSFTTTAQSSAQPTVPKFVATANFLLVISKNKLSGENREASMLIVRSWTCAFYLI